MTLETLQKLTEPVVPMIDHPALMPFIQQFHALQNPVKPLPEESPMAMQQTILPSLNHSVPSEPFCAFSTSQEPLQADAPLSSNQNASLADDDDDEFSDFLSPPSLPTNNNTLVSAANFSSNVIQSSQFSEKPDKSTEIAALKPLGPSFDVSVSSLVPNNVATTASPSLSFDCSQEDDFDDFQSATSDPSALLSSGGCSPPVVPELRPPSSKKDGMFCGSLNAPSFGGTEATGITSTKSHSSLQTLTPTCVSDTLDKYAALRVVDFSQLSAEEPKNLLPTSFKENISSNLSTGGQNINEDDDEFGDFTGAEIAAAPETSQNIISANSFGAFLSNDQIVTNSKVEKLPDLAPQLASSSDFSFNADFSSITPSQTCGKTDVILCDEVTQPMAAPSFPDLGSLTITENSSFASESKFNFPPFASAENFSDFQTALQGFPEQSPFTISESDTFVPSAQPTVTTAPMGKSLLGTDFLRNDKHACQKEMANTPASFENISPQAMVWMNDPPPLPEEEEEDFGDFLGPSVPNTHHNPQNEPITALREDLPTGELNIPSDADAPSLPAEKTEKNVASFSGPPLGHDKYSSIRADDAFSAESAEVCWAKCLKGASSLLTKCVGALEEITSEEQIDCEKIFSTSSMEDFITGENN